MVNTKQNCSSSLNWTSGHRFQNPSRFSFPNHGARPEGVNVLIHKNKGRNWGRLTCLLGLKFIVAFLVGNGEYIFQEKQAYMKESTAGEIVWW